MPYGKDHAAAAHGTCTNGLQFSAAHLSKDWPEGYGYYVSELAKTTPEKKKTTGDGCATAKSEAACAKIDECAWYGPKNTCYKAKRRLKEGAKKVDQCSENKSEASCNEVKGCAWHSPKEVCYSDGSDAKDFSGKDAVVYGDSQWWISDTLVAPSEPGTYVLQWRWDNEQTPQIWTTCADITVVEKQASFAEARKSRLSNAAALLAAIAAVFLILKKK